MQEVTINIDVSGILILKANLANTAVVPMTTTIIQRRVINRERLSISSFSDEVFSGVWVLYGIEIGILKHINQFQFGTFSLW